LGKPAQALRVRCERAVEMLVEAADHISSTPSWFFVQFGLLSLQELAFSISPDGKFVGHQLQVKFRDQPHGLIGIVCPERPAKPSLLRYLPAGASTYAAAPMDLSALVKIHEDVFANHADELPIDRESLEALLAEEGMSLEDMDDPYQLMFNGVSALKSSLARHKAGVVVGIDYFEKHRYVLRSRW
jgi:hypothetical protein